MPSLPQCRISYMDPLMGTKERRSELHRMWFFMCDCKFCHDKERLAMENTIRCGRWKMGICVLVILYGL